MSTADRYTFAGYAIGVLRGFLIIALLMLAVGLALRLWRDRASVAAAIVGGYDRLMGLAAGEESDGPAERW